MKQAAFASIAALAIAGVWATNLRSQQVESQFPGIGTTTAAVSQEGATPAQATQQDGIAELREEYLRLAESRARTMPEYELRDAVQEMQIQSELDPIVQQLRDIVKKHAGDPRDTERERRFACCFWVKMPAPCNKSIVCLTKMRNRER